jgi:hypothetical protein
MINPSLQAFATRALNTGRISFGDVKRLQRDILPDGISSREEAELLLTLDRTVSRADRSFADWLVAMMVDESAERLHMEALDRVPKATPAASTQDSWSGPSARWASWTKILRDGWRPC